MKMKLREQRQNYVVRYRKLMEKIELDGKEILKRYLEIGRVMQAKANKEVHMRSKKMLEDKMKQKTLLVENIGNLRSEIQASDVKLKLVKRRRISFQARENQIAGVGGDSVEESHRCQAFQRAQDAEAVP